MAEQTLLSLQALTKSFGDTKVLKGISLDVKKGEFLTLLGPSGCGKTTTIRIIAGLIPPDAGRVILNGEDVTDLPPNKRNVNTVFQNYALFPHMNVERNITYGLRMRSVPRGRQRELTKTMLDLVRLPGFERRMPSMLSGGQRQRVAIARAVVLEPDVLLLDEPLGALDLKLRQQMQRELKELQTRLGITFIYITHDQEEALNMSDRIAIMNNGAFEQVGAPEDIYERPATRFAAQFIGQGSLFEGEIMSVENGIASIKLAFGDALAASANALTHGAKAAVSVHAERVNISTAPAAGFNIRAEIIAHRYAGSALRTELRLSDGGELVASSLCAASDLPRAGETVYVHWDPKHAAIIGEGLP